MEGTLLRIGVATFAIPGYATHRDGVYRRGVTCDSRQSIKVVIQIRTFETRKREQMEAAQ